MQEENKTEYFQKSSESTNSSEINLIKTDIEKPTKDSVSIKEKLKTDSLENEDATPLYDDPYDIVRPVKTIRRAKLIPHD